jgi:hypothetical protein
VSQSTGEGGVALCNPLSAGQSDWAATARRFNGMINGTTLESAGEGEGAGRREAKSPAFTGLLRAAEGARTLDLLHGKQTL